MRLRGKGLAYEEELKFARISATPARQIANTALATSQSSAEQSSKLIETENIEIRNVMLTVHSTDCSGLIRSVCIFSSVTL